MEIAYIVLAGIAGTAVMSLVMALIHKLGWANADMVRAIGSVYTRSYKTALLPGLFVHFGAGILFAFLYAVLVAVAPVQTTGGTILVTLCTGLFHGMSMGMILAVAVAEHHPLPEFRNAGVGVVLSHVVGHIFYGLTVGLVFVLTHTRLALLSG